MLLLIKKICLVRDKARKFIAKLIFDHDVPLGLVDPVHHILIVRWDAKLGDSFISSFFFREIKKLKNTKISVLTASSLVELHKDYFGADQVIEINKRPSYKKICNIANTLFNVDTVIHLTENMKMRDLYLLHKLQPKNVFSLDDDINMVNIKMGEATRNLSFQKKYFYILKVLGVSDINEEYIIPYKPIVNEKTTYDIVFNPFGSTHHKSISINKSVSLLKKLCLSLPNINIGLLSSPSTIDNATIIVKMVNSSQLSLIGGIDSIYDVIDIIKTTNLVISVDTSIVHIAVGMNKKLVSIYPKNGTSFNPWLPPCAKNIKVIFSHEDGTTVNLNKFDDAEILSTSVKLLNQ